MAVTKIIDTFANLAILTVTESAANTLTFKKMETGISINQKVAWILNRVEYFLSLTAAIFNGDSDYFNFGLSLSDQFTSPALDNVHIVDFNHIMRTDLGAAASGTWIKLPIDKDFSTFPGGGKIIPPMPLYGWAKGTGLASAQTLTCRMYYTVKEMAIDEYWELVEATRPLVS